MAIQSLNPATGKVEKRFMQDSRARLERKVTSARAAFDVLGGMSLAKRKERMLALARLLRGEKERLGRLATVEMGKPITQAVAEVEKCAWVCEYFTKRAGHFLKPEAIPTEAKKSYVRFDPLGTVLAVMPWNFPFWQLFRFAAPAVMAGNTVLLKHASNVPQCALAIEATFRKARFPKGTLQTLLVEPDRVPALLADPRICAATVTGSERAGAAVAGEAGRNLKKTVMELGGSDPFIVLRDADIAKAARQAALARTVNSGQSCIAAKRFVVEKTVAPAFTKAFVAAMERLRVGDPLDSSTEVGPLARADLLETLERQVRGSVRRGARILTGGKRLPAEGFFYAPTVLDNVKRGMSAYDEELFGPVGSVIVAKDASDAMRIANDTPFGLGASIWTRNIKRAQRLAERLETGAVYINTVVKSDPRMPFGGVKRSGYGRELGEYGMKEFVNVKSVVVENS
jgi:succinate-semialdehyde dehydrogenase/glutarate-semialdehyde dehydrogenase